MPCAPDPSDFLCAHSSTHRPSLPWFVNFKLTLGGSSFTVKDGILDNGSDDVLVPKRLIPVDLLDSLEACSYIVNGVNGAREALGQFITEVDIDGNIFNNIRVIVTDHEVTPALIGRTLIDYPSNVAFGRTGTELIVQRRFAPGEPICTQKFKINGYRSDPWNVAQETPKALLNSRPARHVIEVMSAGTQLAANDDQLTPSADQTSSDTRNSTVSTVQPLSRDKPDQNASTAGLIEWLETKKNLKLPKQHKNAEEHHTIARLLVEYEDVFGGENEPLGDFCKPVRIPTTGKSACRKQHQIQYKNQEVIDAEVERMASAGVIEHCKNPQGFSTPLHCVEKKDGSPRLVCNFKNTLNTVLKDPDPYTMPNLREVFNEVRPGIMYMASVDYRIGYWQIPLDKRCRHKTAFTWRGLTWQYRRLPFGLSCAWQIFCRCVGQALETITNRDGLYVYIDDVLVATPTFSAFVQRLRTLFEASRQFGLRLHPGKCNFLAHSCKFLGRILSREGMSVDPDHASGIDSLTHPTSRSELRTQFGRLTFIREFLDTRLYEQIDTSCFSQLVYELN